jgi:hypothetical protein
MTDRLDEICKRLAAVILQEQKIRNEHDSYCSDECMCMAEEIINLFRDALAELDKFKIEAATSGEAEPATPERNLPACLPSVSESALSSPPSERERLAENVIEAARRWTKGIESSRIKWNPTPIQKAGKEIFDALAAYDAAKKRCTRNCAR